MPLTANFLADFSSFITAARDATTSTEQLVEAAGKVGADVDHMIAQTAGSMRQAATGIADFAKSTYAVLSSSQVRDFVNTTTEAVMGFVHEFAEGEQATARLTAALKDAGQASPAVIEAYGQMATHLQSVSRFSDEAITDVQTMFTTLGNVGPENMQKVLEATMALALGMGKTLPEAGQLMIKAAQSDGEALGKLKKVFGDTIPEGATFADILEAINKKFNSQVQADMETTAGKLANIKNQMSDINEQIGKVLADNLKTVLEVFKSLPEGLQTFTISVVALGSALAPILISLSSVVQLLGYASLGAALTAAGAALAAFAVPIGLVGAALYELWGIWHYWDELVLIMKNPIDAIWTYLEVIWPASFKVGIEVVKQFYNAIKTWLWDNLSALIDNVVKLPAKVTAAFGAMYDAIIGHSYVPDLMNGIARHFATLDYIMVNPALAAAQVVYGAFAPLSDPMNNFSAGAAGGGGAVWGNAAAGGGGGTVVNVTVNMSGMLGTDDPQTRSAMADLVSDAVMQGMRGTRLLGTA